MSSLVTETSTMSNKTFDIEDTNNGSMVSSNNNNSIIFHSDANYFMKFWLDGVFRLVVGSLGIFMNSFAIWILVSEQKMQNLFFHILACSLISDNGYLLMDMFCALYHEFNVYSLAWILPYTAYPLKRIFYTSNILTTLFCLMKGIVSSLVIRGNIAPGILQNFDTKDFESTFFLFSCFPLVSVYLLSSATVLHSMIMMTRK